MTKDQAQEFLAESEYWARPENRPPELCNKKKDEESALVVTTGIDIWELGNILRELTNIGHSLNSAPYSPRLMALQEMLLSPNPRDRPSADYILRYLADKKNSPTKPDSTKQNRVEPPVPVPVPVPIAGTGGTKYTYLCGNSSRGWVEGATLDEDSQPDYAFVAKLLKETWEDPAGKIAKFYESLQHPQRHGCQLDQGLRRPFCCGFSNSILSIIAPRIEGRQPRDHPHAPHEIHRVPEGKTKGSAAVRALYRGLVRPGGAAAWNRIDFAAANPPESYWRTQ